MLVSNSMAQRSITSFFKPVPQKTEENTNEQNGVRKKTKVSSENEEKTIRSEIEATSPLEESPIKHSKKRNSKRARVLSSDDEDQGSPEKKGTPEVLQKSLEQTSNSPQKVQKSETKKQKVKKSKLNGAKPKSEIEEVTHDVKTDEEPSQLKEKSGKAENEKVVEGSPGGKKINPFGKRQDENSTYNPNVPKYHPIKSATWQHKEKVPYSALSRTFEEIEKVSARLKMIEILSNYFRSVIVLTPEDLLPSVYLCLNKLAPAYEGLELGIAETSLMKAIACSTGRSMSQIKADIHEVGDIGLVAEKSKSNQRTLFTPAMLTVRGVFEKLKEIAKMTGHASQMKKVEKIQSMFVACRAAEARYLIRSLAGKLRIGLAEQSALQALALACAMTPTNQEYPPEVLDRSKDLSAEAFKAEYENFARLLKTAYCECPSYDKIIPVILREGMEKLPDHCKLTPGIPLKPMLAHPTKGVNEVLQRFEGLTFTCEWKYDGERAQIHMNGTEVHIYSRNQENNTSKYPDIISRIGNCKTEEVESCILDCEAVAWDKENKQLLPFQVLSTRKRKDANETDIKVQVCVFIFDLLYLNGEPLIRRPFVERRSLLKQYFKETEGEWLFAKHLDTTVMEEVQEFLEESVKGNCEGLMVKTLEKDATYEIAKRSRNWLKLKKDYLDGVGDTLDVVVIGGYLGKGKRTGCYGGFLLACYDKDNEEYQSVCKIGTGFSDEMLQTHSEFLKNHIISEPKPYYRYDGTLEPDHWFDAAQVWEIKCADLSLSPVHRAGIGIVDPEKGISLRFPRFIRIRDDKTVEEATTAQQIAFMYSNQEQVKNQQQETKFNEEDFY